jgi:hypothetical protein
MHTFLKIAFLILFLFSRNNSTAQNLGGSFTYNFLKLAASPQANALGGNVVSVFNNDINLVHQNPSLLQPKMHNHLGANINFMYGDSKNMFANYSMYKSKWNTTFQGGIIFMNYGKQNATDASGNSLGSFTANDFTMQVTASRKYLQKWNYGTTLKLIGSQYGQYKSYGIAMDLGLNYIDSAKLFQVGVVFKNIGAQLKSYVNTNKEALPFELQLGIAKRLEKAPLQFIFTVTNAHQLDIRYADTTFEKEINGTVKKGKFTVDKLFRHFILAAQIYPSKTTEITIAYNYLRRKELTLFNIGNGFTGLSFGGGLLFNTYQIRYARAYFQNNKAFNQLGLSINFMATHQ